MHDAGEGPGGVLLGEDAADVGVGVAGVDDQRQAGPARGLDVEAQALGLQRGGLGAVVVVEAGLADADELRGAAASATRASTVAIGSSWTCSGWLPAAQKTPACASAIARTASAWRSRVQIVTMRVTPAAAARATTASISPSKSGKSRWQWLSTRAGGGIGLASVRVQAAWARASAAAASICRNVSRITWAGSRLTARAWVRALGEPRAASVAQSRPCAGRGAEAGEELGLGRREGRRRQRPRRRSARRPSARLGELEGQRVARGGGAAGRGVGERDEPAAVERAPRRGARRSRRRARGRRPRARSSAAATEPPASDRQPRVVGRLGPGGGEGARRAPPGRAARSAARGSASGSSAAGRPGGG